MSHVEKTTSDVEKTTSDLFSGLLHTNEKSCYNKLNLHVYLSINQSIARFYTNTAPCTLICAAARGFCDYTQHIAPHHKNYH